MTKFEEYLQKKKREYGEKFDPSSLAPQFIPYFNNERRIIVQIKHGEEISGKVGVSTGWRPVFLLLKKSTSTGSSDILGQEDLIVAVQNQGSKNYSYYVTVKGRVSQ